MFLWLCLENALNFCLDFGSNGGFQLVYHFLSASHFCFSSRSAHRCSSLLLSDGRFCSQSFLSGNQQRVCYSITPFAVSGYVRGNPTISCRGIDVFLLVHLPPRKYTRTPAVIIQQSLNKTLCYGATLSANLTMNRPSFLATAVVTEPHRLLWRASRVLRSSCLVTRARGKLSLSIEPSAKVIACIRQIRSTEVRSADVQ